MREYKIVQPRTWGEFRISETSGQTWAEFPTITRDATLPEIIDILERENDLLHQTLDKLKEYVGEDYFKAAQELEEFLQKNYIKEIK